MSMTAVKFDVEAIRAEFPSLALAQDGQHVVYLDGPGGTQVPGRVIDAITDCLRSANANQGGAFLTSRHSDEITDSARAAVADFYGADSPDEIKFGANMTTLTFHFSRSIAATMAPGDEILITTLDHEANRSTWQAAARERDLVIKTVGIRLEDGTLDLDDFARKLSPRTKLVAVGYASNALGTINPIPEICRLAHAAGAWAYIDAVHYAPHAAIDVKASGADFMVSSAYKWFGPHVGAIWARTELLDSLPAYKVRPAHDRFETGTLNLEGIAGVGAAVGYIESVGRRFGGVAAGAPRRSALLGAMAAIRDYELGLMRRFISGLSGIPGVRVWGITDPARYEAERAPTVSITLDRLTAGDAAAALAKRGIFAWDGDFYATALVEHLGLADRGGLLRLGLVHYNTAAEVDRTLEAIEALTH